MTRRWMYIEHTGIFKQVTWLRMSINYKYWQQDQMWFNEKKSQESRTTVAHTWQPLCSHPLAHNGNCRRKLAIPSCFLVWCVHWSHCFPASSKFVFLFCRTQSADTITAHSEHVKVHTKKKGNSGNTTDTTGLKTNIKHKKISWAFKKKQTVY